MLSDSRKPQVPSDCLANTNPPKFLFINTLFDLIDERFIVALIADLSEMRCLFVFSYDCLLINFDVSKICV